MPNDYYTMIFTGEKTDELLKLTVDNNGTVKATEVTS